MKMIMRCLAGAIAVFSASLLAAAGMESFVPGDSEFLAVLEVKPLADHPEATGLLNSRDGRKYHALLNSITGLDFRKDIKEVWLFGNADQQGGLLFRIKNSDKLISRMDARDFPKQVARVSRTFDEEVTFSRVVQNGRVLYLFDNDDSGKIALTPVDKSGIWLAVRFEHIDTVLNAKKITAREMDGIMRHMPDETYFLRAVWINRSYRKSGDKKGIQDDFKVVSAGFKTGGKNNLDQYYMLRLVCGSADQAFVQSMLLPGYFQLGAGMVFNKQPQLAEELFKKFISAVEGDSVLFTLHVPEALYGKLRNVAGDMAKDVFAAPAPVPADIKSGEK